MVKQTIQIFARIKPTKAKHGIYEISEEEGCQVLSLIVPKEISDGLVNNKRDNFKFKFSKIFDQPTKQDEVFDAVAKPVIDNVLAGYNGTIFAYGQTGSGKTFTITGGAERYIDRGIIPRSLSYIFEYYKQNPENVYTTHVSYLEIYNDSGYDLLDPKHEASKLEDLPKVSLMEDSDQNIHLRNLSTHQANNEEESLNLLFLGDTNRMIAETPMNQASTRSHCIFTIHVTSREAGSATIRRSKLHLVDLAGSERVAKSGVDGLLLTEAKYINLSLHFLEQVIVSLSEKSRSHIPYRNSMMTSVLRDSLGGNCMTTMIATCSINKKNIAESISTCRFAQRVALIKNDAILNEELDPKLMIARLKREVAQLKEELAMATGDQRTDNLTDEDLDRCEEAVAEYLEDSDPEAILKIGPDLRKIHQCFWLLKQRILNNKSGSPSRANSVNNTNDTEKADISYLDSVEMKKLKDLVTQRDNEINILVGMLKKEKKRAADAVQQLERRGIQPQTRESTNNESGISSYGSSKQNSASSYEKDSRDMTRSKMEVEEKRKTKILGEMSMGRQEAFEIFRRDYENNQHIDENKQTLKNRYAEAKVLGEKVNQSRTKINRLKSHIEQYRMSRVMQGLVNPEDPEEDETEKQMRMELECEKSKYKECFSQLRNLKTQIEHLQHLLEKSKVKLLKDFEIWWAEQAAIAEQQQMKLQSLPDGRSKKAWNTPPITPTSNTQPASSLGSQSSLASDFIYSNRTDRSNGSTRQSLSGSNLRTGKHENNMESSRKSHSAAESSIPLTGDPQADADIKAFLRARQNVMKYANMGQR